MVHVIHHHLRDRRCPELRRSCYGLREWRPPLKCRIRPQRYLKAISKNVRRQADPRHAGQSWTNVIPISCWTLLPPEATNVVTSSRHDEFGHFSPEDVMQIATDLRALLTEVGNMLFSRAL